ncbi:MAG: hypothetical protein M1335_03370 [Chloroflexi bacterium]|nr:hypothetical protein [Chloroflexota bacterium]
MNRPVILRFTTDTFMDDFMGMLEKDPSKLPALAAQPETWRGPLDSSTTVTGIGQAPNVPRLVRKLERLRLKAGKSEGKSSAIPVATLFSKKSNADMLKLYQPAHQRYYLVSSCLVCEMTGMPDRAVDPGRSERAFFVLRRMLPPDQTATGEPLPEYNADTWEEYAYIATDNGGSWKRVGKSSGAAAGSSVEGEEHLPMFGVKYRESDDRIRRLFAGLIPVGKREAYMAAASVGDGGTASSSGTPLPKTSRKIHFRSQVAEPWKNIIDQAARFNKVLTEPSDPSPYQFEIDALKKNAREQLQTQSWLVLLDFAAFLEKYAASVWDAILDSSKEGGLSAAETALLNGLKNVKTTSALVTALTGTWVGKDDHYHASPYSASDIKGTLYLALKAIAGDTKLETATGSYDRSVKGGKWPAFLFPLADLEKTALTFSNGVTPLGAQDQIDVDEQIAVSEAADVQTQKANVDKLVALVIRAMPTESAEAVPPLPLAAQPVLDTRDGIFVVRTVFDRPNCGPLKPTLLSEPSRPFKLAGFFDPDAPARPIRIALPIDTSPAGLRKFDKNTAFMISDVLCGQIQRAKGLTLGDLVLSVLPWPFHKDLPVPDTGPCQTSGGDRLGMICSLSIPIITICALILLMIIVNLLDFIFRWIPYFIMCFPLPGFKGKK